MSDVIMIGCDLHDASMVLKLALGTEAPVRKTWATKNPDGLIVYLNDFSKKKGAKRIVFAYEVKTINSVLEFSSSFASFAPSH